MAGIFSEKPARTISRMADIFGRKVAGTIYGRASFLAKRLLEIMYHKEIKSLKVFLYRNFTG
jgi:hypothetical protein